MALEATEFFYYVENDVIVEHPVYKPAPYPRPQKFGPNDPDWHLANHGHWRQWIDDPGPPGEYQNKIIGTPIPNPGASPARVERVDTLQPMSAGQIRSRKQSQIVAQVPGEATLGNTRTDFMEPELVRYASEANAKTIELQQTADEDVESFDPTLDLVTDHSDERNSRFSINIRELQPWAARPDDIYGWVATLTMEADQASVGAEARVVVKDAPSDVGAVIPMVQDAMDPTIWRAEARDGHKWADPENSASIQLLWGLGSEPTSPVITSERLHDRRSTVTRYWHLESHGQGRQGIDDPGPSDEHENKTIDKPTPNSGGSPPRT